ncbi:ribosomal protein S6 kinase alpha-5 [Trichomycterus rosablanca]|uniref:ribosomal protein S6 kinase alpha-5 n=1 Tax=Trichomycterus rosablanca TaxID=2290929 RepID=UPI002F35EA46
MDPPRTLAQGCFGKVYKMKFRDTWAAVKKVPDGHNTKEQLLREMRVYEKARHKNLVRLLEYPWLEGEKWIIPMEFIFGEDLETAIFNRPKSQIKLSPAVVATIISGMCEGLFHLHSKNIVHQDLKPDNIMIEHGTHRAVIIDMGLAKLFVNGLTSATNLGNEAYAAPEIWQGHVRDKRSDVWAMGKIIDEIFTRNRREPKYVNSCQVRQTLKDNPYSDDVSRMVKTNATERATMADVIGEIRQIEAQQVDGVPYTGTDKHRCTKGSGAVNPDAKQKTTPGAQTLIPAGANMFAPMSALFTLPSDVEMTQRRFENGQFMFKEIVTVNAFLIDKLHIPSVTTQFSGKRKDRVEAQKCQMDPPRTLARGCFGKVYKMKYRGTWAAVKKVPDGHITKEQLFREMQVYEKARHINLVRLLEYPWLEGENWVIPMEFILGEDLETAILHRSKSQIELSPAVVANIISGMCEGLFHLHSKNIVHQDLKPDNIMIEYGTHRAVIVDMGLAKFFVKGITPAENQGNKPYAAPEVFQRDNRDKRSDVWAMGKIIAEIFTGYRWDPNYVCSSQVRQVLKDNPYSDVVSRMVKTKATERATMAEVIGEIRQIGAQQGRRY